MTLPEFIRANARWDMRLWCRLFSHLPYGRNRKWHPCDEAEDRRPQPSFCARCGKDLP